MTRWTTRAGAFGLPLRRSHRRGSHVHLVAALATVVALISTLLSAAPATAATAQPIAPACDTTWIQPDLFHDVPNVNVHESAVDCIVHWGLSRGSGGLYLPAAPVTREQMATFIARAVTTTGGRLPGSPADAFRDDDGSPHETAINRLAAAGVVSGRDGNRFDPGATVSRGEMATFLVRAWSQRTGRTLPSSESGFVDIGNSVHAASITAAANAGLVSGVDATHYAPNRAVGRDQMASFLARWLARLVDRGFTAAKRAPAGSPPGADYDPPAPDFPSAPPGSYAFGAVHADGSPARFDPCSPIHVVANFTGAPRGAKEALGYALAQLAAGTGMRFVYDGTTDERQTETYASRAIFQPDRYGRRWAPVLVNWPATWTGGSLNGWGAFEARGTSLVPTTTVSGIVALNRHASLSQRALRGLMMHEFGHVLGLAHVDAPGEVMVPVNAPDDWGSGDLAGLARVGRPAGCIADAPLP